MAERLANANSRADDQRRITGRTNWRHARIVRTRAFNRQARLWTSRSFLHRIRPARAPIVEEAAKAESHDHVSRRFTEKTFGGCDYNDERTHRTNHALFLRLHIRHAPQDEIRSRVACVASL